MKRNIALVLSLFVCIIGFIGCSSSSSSEPTATERPDNLITGQFIASTVEGLDYRTTGYSDSTEGDGTFSYPAGETVTFAIGDLVLGTTTGKDLVTILDLVPGATNIDNVRALNIARLLQSLDSDGDPRNGIQLTQQIKDELVATQIDLDLPTETFETDPAVIDLFERLNAQQAFSGSLTGSLRSAADAKAHFIQAYKDTWKAQWVSMDTNGDGEEDTLVEYFFDTAGRLILTEVTPNGLDEPTSIERREYDTNGFLTLRQNEENGSIVYDEAYENDDQGNRIKRWYDSDRDGEWDIYDEYEYDAHGNMTKVSNGDAEGSFHSIVRYLFDDDGNPTGREDDSNANGVADSIWTNVYENGRLVRENYDDNADGTVDRAIHYTYDANGNRLSTSYDHNNNGIFTDQNEWVQTYTYGANNLMKTMLTQFANSGTSSYTEREYDANGNIILERGDSDYNGVTPDWNFKRTRQYDSNNRLVHYGVDWDFSGVYDEEFEFVYDDFGNVVESAIYSNGTLSRRYFIYWEQNVTSGFGTWFAPYGSEICG